MRLEEQQRRQEAVIQKDRVSLAVLCHLDCSVPVVLIRNFDIGGIFAFPINSKYFVNRIT